MLVPVFTLKFHNKINPRLVTVGSYDGVNPCLTGATTGGKVFVHNPGSRGLGKVSKGRSEVGTQGDISLLNINQIISSVAAGRLSSTATCDSLVVGTQTNVLGYDVMNNRDMFYKDMADGANAVAIGKLGSIEAPLAIVGGNCSIQGFDSEGNDSFWTVTGDNVCSLSLVDFNEDGKLELVVGSDDFDIRVFMEDEIIAEMTETEAITSLCPIFGSQFGYCLNNGTVGVYGQSTRLWRIKSKNIPMSIFAYDLDGDGVKELITGWSNGKIDARNTRSGEIIFKDTFSAAVAGIVEADYRNDGHQLLICCSVDGDVKGFVPAGQELQGNLMDVNVDQEAIRELSQKKQHLLMELKNYEENQTAAKLDRPSGLGDLDRQQMGIIPANTEIRTAVYVTGPTQEQPTPGLVLQISTSNDTIIRAVIVFAEGIFDGESHCVHPAANDVSNSLKVVIHPPKDIPVDLYLKVFVGNKNSMQFHVFEATRPLPRFCLYSVIPDGVKCTEPQSYVSFHVTERINRVIMWVTQSFLLDAEPKADSLLDLRFICLRNMRPMFIRMTSSGEVCIRTDDMDLAGDVLQELCSFLGINDLTTTADFPAEFLKLGEVLNDIQEFQTTRQKLSSDMADHSNVIRAFVVRAEDARIMGDMRGMRQAYQTLYNMNHDIISGYRIRCNNHQELLARLKTVNLTIQRAARLRMGKYKTEVVNACREAVKNNNLGQLVKIMKTGSS